jgi:hypothetical protein
VLDVKDLKKLNLKLCATGTERKWNKAES